MPYTNTQHPSNTRTTVTIVMYIIFGVSIIPTTALGLDADKTPLLYFNLENTDAPTLYQEVRVKFRRGTSADFVEFKTADQFYFIETANTCDAKPTCDGDTKQCTVTPNNARVTLWSVVKDSNGGTAQASIIIKSGVFSVNTPYKMCYLQNDAQGQTSVREASYTISDDSHVPASFTVKSSIYTAQAIDPTDVYAGQGPVTLTITVDSQRALINKQVTQPAYLIPCTAAECPNEAFADKDKDKMAGLCSLIGNRGAIKTAAVTGFGSTKLTTTFIAPVIPATHAYYRVCVPYCFKAATCDSSTISWSLVNSDTAIKILPANPLSYTIDTTSTKILTFTGTGLKKGDKIRILAAGQVAKGLLCPNTPSATFPNTLYAAEVTATSNPTSNGETITFSIDAKHADAAIGQVCYSLGGNPNLWAPVFQTADNTALYFSLENAHVPTLYQELKVKIRRGPDNAPDPKFTASDKFAQTDKVYFIETLKKCKANPTACVVGTGTAGAQICKVDSADVTVWSVVGSDNFAILNVIVKSSEFKECKTYKMCYIKNEGKDSPKVYEASSTLTSVKDTPVSFTVLPSIYTTHVTHPATVHAGQGPVTLTITAEEATGKTFGHTQVPKVPFLTPCTTAECSDKDDIAALCSKDSTGNADAVTTVVVKGLGTGTLTTTFSAPVTTATKSYMICVPYCFKAGTCAVDDVSWALVNSNTPIKIFPANPLSYTIKPGSPYTLTFTGTGLLAGDKIRIQTEAQAAEKCVFSSSAASPADYTAEVDAFCPTVSGSTSTVSKFLVITQFVTPSVNKPTVKGQVCYSRADSPKVWAPVIQTEDNTALYFSLENADAPTLYQEVRVKIRKGSAADDDTQFVFAATDKFYFIEKAENCIANPSCVAAVGTDGTQICQIGSDDVTLWSVTEDSGNGVATVVIKSADFEAGASYIYKMCYIKKDAGDTCGVVYEASYTLSSVGDKPAQFTIRPSIYTTHKTSPVTVYAGQGPVTLTITGNTGRAKGNTGMTQFPYLIPCATADCSNNAFKKVNKDKDRMASLCSKHNNNGAITTAVVKGLRTGTLTTTFIAPVTPATPASYGICVPYCFKTRCEDSEISWTLVNSDTPIEFEPANPSSYTIDPSSPNILTFTGNNLKKGDKIRILTEGQVSQEKLAKGELCVFSATVSSENGEYTEEIIATSDPISVSKSTLIKYTLKSPLQTPFTGQVCYSRKDSLTVWAPVIQSAGQTGRDPIITPKVPTGFTFVPHTPEIGQELELTFTGTDGLDAQDSSLLAKCAPETTSTQTSTVISPGICADTNKANQYSCVITKDVQSIKCKAHIDARATNSRGMRLCVCYKKKGESKYALVKGSVDISPKAKSPAGLPDEPVPPRTDKDEVTPLKNSDTALSDPSAEKKTHVPSKAEKEDIHVKKPETPKNAKQNSGEEIGNKEPKAAEKPVSHNTDKDVNVLIPQKKPVAPKTEKEVKTDPPENKQVPSKKKEIPPHKPETPKEPKQDGEAGKKDKTAGKTLIPKPATVPKTDASADKDSKTNGGKVPPTSAVTVPSLHDVNKSTTLSATAISSTIPAVLITSVVFLYLYNW